LTLQVLHGDCLDLLPTLDADSISAVVTDPPYHLHDIKSVPHYGTGGFGNRSHEQKAARAGFMGKSWDGGDIAFRPDTWRAVLRVMRPGAYMVCFGGTRTAHRLACAIEDAGFEIRDTLCWLYGSGFPKSLDVSKAIDKAAGATREVVGEVVSPFKVDKAEAARVAYGEYLAGINENGYRTAQITAPATPEAQQWSGWGTALKPAHEPIILARKPLQGTVATNVLRHGTGAVNVDACRVPAADLPNDRARHGGGIIGNGSSYELPDSRGALPSARWPANVLHDGSPEVLEAFARFGDAPGQQRSSSDAERSQANVYGVTSDCGKQYAPRNDTGSAARFFYSAKADASDRADSRHPTVKPVALMRWLVRLITPPSGTVLDPFAGSGTTGEAAMLEGRDALLIEREAQHAADIAHRINRWSGADTPLFTEAAD
jgi:site-specific DNA-methyltransferase (adenine-specific)